MAGNWLQRAARVQCRKCFMWHKNKMKHSLLWCKTPLSYVLLHLRLETMPHACTVPDALYTLTQQRNDIARALQWEVLNDPVKVHNFMEAVNILIGTCTCLQKKCAWWKPIRTTHAHTLYLQGMHLATVHAVLPEYQDALHPECRRTTAGFCDPAHCSSCVAATTSTNV